jgi:hypothetical protein
MLIVDTGFLVQLNRFLLVPTQSIGMIKSKQLLTTAKRAVELATETNEQTALDFITDSINSGIQTNV